MEVRESASGNKQEGKELQRPELTRYNSKESKIVLLEERKMMAIGLYLQTEIQYCIITHVMFPTKTKTVDEGRHFKGQMLFICAS